METETLVQDQPKTRRKKPIVNEPIISEDNYKIDLINALNWYNENWSEKNYRDAAEYFVKNILKFPSIDFISNSSFLSIRKIGVIGHLIRRAQYIDIDNIQKLTQEVINLSTNYKPQTIVLNNKPNPNQRLLNLVQVVASDVDQAIDDFILKNEVFSMKTYLIMNNISSAVAKKVGLLFNDLNQELLSAINISDNDIVENYRLLPRRRLVQFQKMIESIINDCNQVNNKPKTRKVTKLTKNIKRRVKV
jgi:hypothetical protein